MESNKIRWGILGTGWIANDFTSALKTLDDAEVKAVGSRSIANAERFGNKFDIPNRHSSYKALVTDPEVDIVHIATPHIYHKEHALLALSCGKAVLCEKPFTINAVEAKQVIEFAQKQKLFLMEAMWGRFTPGQQKVRELLSQQVIGEIKSFSGYFGSEKEYDPDNRFFKLSMAGGALLDVGIYPLSLMHMVLGKPESILSMVDIGDTGVDESNAASFRYHDGRTASIVSSIRTKTLREGIIMGEKGNIKVHSPLTFPPAVSVCHPGKKPKIYNTAYDGWGFVFEAKESMRCIREGLTESPLLPLSETHSIMQVLDELRLQWGLKYPGE